MFSLTDINTMANKKTIASRIYNHIVNLLETPAHTALDGFIGDTVGEVYLLTDNANQDGFKFACDPENTLFSSTLGKFADKEITMEIFPEFYSSHIGMKLVVYTNHDEMTGWAAKQFMDTLNVEQLNKIAEAMAWLMEAYGKGIVNGDGTISGYITEYMKK
jgi:hypothetical protein